MGARESSSRGSQYDKVDGLITGQNARWGVLSNYTWGSSGDVLIDHTSTDYQPYGQIDHLTPEADQKKLFQIPIQEGSLETSVFIARLIGDNNNSIDAFEYDRKTGLATFKSGVIHVCPTHIYETKYADRYEIHFKMSRFSNGSFFVNACAGLQETAAS